jgi:hypothetical protein
MLHINNQTYNLIKKKKNLTADAAEFYLVNSTCLSSMKRKQINKEIVNKGKDKNDIVE